MANHIKIDPVGIDKAIQRIQVRLYKRLGYINIEGYGRIYPILVKGNMIPAHFIEGTDYKDVLFNDKNKSNGNFFFNEDPLSKKVNSEQVESKINLIFQLDVNQIKSGSDFRKDEEIRAEIETELRHTAFQVEEITRGLKALDGFDHNLGDRKLLFLKFTGKIRYQLNC